MKLNPRVLIVEDEPAIAELIAVNLRHHGFDPVITGDAQSAQAAVNERLPDLILLDWMLPGSSGVELAKSWRGHSRTKDLPIIFLTARSEEVDKVRGLDAGADDYITKPFSVQELMARARALLRRRLPEAVAEVIAIQDLILDAASHRVSLNGVALKLGPTEFKLLHFLMKHPDRVHSRSNLLDKVWGDHVYIEERTVDVHVKRLRESLDNFALRIETVRGSGYLFNSKFETRVHRD